MTAIARPVTGRHVLVWVLSFFGVVVAVNAAFVWFALDTFPGLSTRHAYEEGLEYNRTLDAARAQKALGWASAVGIDPAGRLDVRMTGADGAPLSGLAVAVALRRPVRADDDRDLVLAEGPAGVYSAEIADAAGRWLATVRATGTAGRVYQMEHDLLVRTRGER